MTENLQTSRAQVYVHEYSDNTPGFNHAFSKILSTTSVVLAFGAPGVSYAYNDNLMPGSVQSTAGNIPERHISNAGGKFQSFLGLPQMPPISGEGPEKLVVRAKQNTDGVYTFRQEVKRDEEPLAKAAGGIDTDSVAYRKLTEKISKDCPYNLTVVPGGGNYHRRSSKLGRLLLNGTNHNILRLYPKSGVSTCGHMLLAYTGVDSNNKSYVFRKRLSKKNGYIDRSPVDNRFFSFTVPLRVKN